MKLRTFNLFVLLILFLGIVACGDKPVPAQTIDSPKPTSSEVTPKTKPGVFSQEQLIEDAQQLAAIIENTHPDPYIRGGGKIAFHRRLQRLLEAIPKEGMLKEDTAGYGCTAHRSFIPHEIHRRKGEGYAGSLQKIVLRYH